MEHFVFNKDEAKDTLPKVTYAFGVFQSESVNGGANLDWEEIIELAKVIRDGWENGEDIQSREEHDYVIPYALRKWGELFQNQIEGKS